MVAKGLSNMVDFLDAEGRVIASDLRAFVSSHPDDEDAKRPLYDAIDAYEKIRELEKVNSESLNAIVAAAKCSSHPVGTFGRNLLLNLIGEHSLVHQSVQELAENTKAKQRSEILSAVGLYAPECNSKKALLRRGLADKAISVREEAINQCGASMLTDLEHRQEVEADPELKEQISRTIKELSGNHVVDPNPGCVKLHSFYRRVEGPNKHFVVNCILENRWLQLDIVFRESRHRLFNRVRCYETKPARPGVEPRLSKDKVVKAVLQGIEDENKVHGTNLVADEITFRQCDFDCYKLYKDAARLLVRQIASAGEFSELTVYGPTT